MRSSTCSRIPFHYATNHQRGASSSTRSNSNHPQLVPINLGLFLWAHITNVYI